MWSTSVEARDADTGELVTGRRQRPSHRVPGEGDDPTDWWQSLVLRAHAPISARSLQVVGDVVLAAVPEIEKQLLRAR